MTNENKNLVSKMMEKYKNHPRKEKKKHKKRIVKSLSRARYLFDNLKFN